jgi:hypothetical protein
VLFTALEDSPSSGSDYEVWHKVQLREQKKKADTGHVVSDTEFKDADLNHELSAEVVPETSEMHTPWKGSCCKKTKQPGLSQDARPSQDASNEANDAEHESPESSHHKETQQHGPSQYTSVSNKEDVDCDHANQWKVSRPLFKAAWLEAQQLAALVVEEAENIAQKCQKNTHHVILATGLGVLQCTPETHSICLRNGMPTTIPEKTVSMLYLTLPIILLIKDPKKHTEALQPIWDYMDSLDAVGDTDRHALKMVVSTMQAAKDQFTTLVGATTLLLANVYLGCRLPLITAWSKSKWLEQLYTLEQILPLSRFPLYSAGLQLSRMPLRLTHLTFARP